MSNKSKYEGIDSRTIKCPCGERNCAEAGISFDENYLRFHFLEHIEVGDKKILTQTTKSMMLDKKTAEELISYLKEIK